MPWQLIMFLRCFLGFGVIWYMMKIITGLPSRTRSLLWQYIFAVVLAILFGLFGFFWKVDFFSKRYLIVMVIGFFNAFACYCLWRATDISMSRTALFAQGDDLIAFSLGCLILKEGNLLNIKLIIGILFCIGAALFISYQQYKQQKNSNRENQEIVFSKSSKLYLWIATYSIIWGISGFSKRYFSLTGMAPQTYIPAWYQGAVLAALIIFLIAGKKESGTALKPKQLILVFLLAFVIVETLIYAYWVNMTAPLAITRPIEQIAEMLIPLFMGLFIFKEKKELNRAGKIAMAIGVSGAIIIMLAY